MVAAITVTHPLVAIPSAIAALLLAWQVIWKRGLVPLGKFVQGIIRIAEATPVLVEIAEEFRPNGGNSLRDTVDRIERNSERLEAGVLESIRIGNVNTERLIESGDQLHEHLRLTAWSEERAEVLARLRLVEDRQDRLVNNMVRLLGQAGEDHPIARVVASAIEDAVREQTD